MNSRLKKIVVIILIMTVVCNALACDKKTSKDNTNNTEQEEVKITKKDTKYSYEERKQARQKELGIDTQVEYSKLNYDTTIENNSDAIEGKIVIANKMFELPISCENLQQYYDVIYTKSYQERKTTKGRDRICEPAIEPWESNILDNETGNSVYPIYMNQETGRYNCVVQNLLWDAAKIEECYIMGITVGYESKNGSKTTVFPKNITFKSTKDDVIKAYGEPKSITKSDYTGTDSYVYIYYYEFIEDTKVCKMWFDIYGKDGENTEHVKKYDQIKEDEGKIHSMSYYFYDTKYFE